MVNREHFCTLLNLMNKIGVMACFILIAITLTSCSQEKPTGNISEKSTINNGTEKPDNSIKVEISMEDAISIGKTEAAKYYENLLLTEVHSFDNDENPDICAGENGKRQYWYVNFANEKENYVNILISNGKVDIVENYDNNGNYGLLDLSQVKLTAEDAVKKAKEMGLKGGNPNNENEWVRGYNFSMSNGSLTETPDDNRIFLEVIGISPNGNFAHVDFDAVTGEVLLAEEKIEYDNEDFEWKKFE